MWQERKFQEIIENTLTYFKDKVVEDPDGNHCLGRTGVAESMGTFRQ